ncbi:hypothetical protein PABG_06477 [Paracoccidioides brasiliensis Pb03]|uniref:Uncharacterized protein n=2 Tax=Paracoccidioides brasiliensis TaxID=121759 RepID=A0A0A0HT82_PARBD|nr:uncharacterized protein PADG_12376 [Paracoccidioides brasiliensis Pb18]EEH16390.1 hypothetical protein PABG_06477 [Paracoccidioides brasiliensis Pb03]KGM91518.1 hypothetical protein PADG_12376 [Paracoccidioides brasiliensis Pb18]ODH14624.1 hypothetical protein ACO22_06539 [Paracoccidioides brasiliensis]ODH49289.1 hypothetical protein GX48_04629 [Paracoccidioides brasiliensis]
MSDRDRAQWHENPPSSPYSKPSIAHWEDDMEPESNFQLEESPNDEFNGDGVGTTAPDTEISISCSGEGDHGLNSDGSDVETFPDFVDDESFQAVEQSQPESKGSEPSN